MSAEALKKVPVSVTSHVSPTNIALFALGFYDILKRAKCNLDSTYSPSV